MTEAPRFRRFTPERRSAMLVQAGIACLARGGLAAFTIDNIAREAGVSRGLIAHHFGGKDGLLAAVHAEAYRGFLDILAPDGAEPSLRDVLDRAFSAELFNRDTLKIWLALWGEISVNPALRDEHRRRYDAYLDHVERAIARHAAAAGRRVDARALARPVVAVIDGLWLEVQIDPERLSAGSARAAALAILEPALGPI